MKTTRLNVFVSAIGFSTMIFLSSCGESSSLPEDIADESSEIAPGTMISVEKALAIVAKENDVARKLYTKGIVGPGKKQGLKFDEDWRKDEVEAGPLPALFLRGISSDIQKGDIPLGLFLGSDFPINAANKFEGQQADLFVEIRKDSEPKFFFDEENELHTAMFPDFASATPCVSCHNGHEKTSKDDWVLGDVMGATTWTYPKKELTFSEVQGIIKVYRTGIVNTLAQYMSEIDGFKESEKPAIGDKWPSEGMFLPSPEVFLDSVKVLASTETLDALLD